MQDPTRYLRIVATALCFEGRKVDMSISMLKTDKDFESYARRQTFRTDTTLYQLEQQVAAIFAFIVVGDM